MSNVTLNLAEIPFESGAVHFRYSRVMATDGSRWLKHGLFVEYSEDGIVLAEGTYHLGKEHGVWKEFHPSGQVAAEGIYENGLEEGVWRFWDKSGNLERTTVFAKGKERA